METNHRTNITMCMINKANRTMHYSTRLMRKVYTHTIPTLKWNKAHSACAESALTYPVLLTCQVTVTVGDSGLCCCICVTSFNCQSTPLFLCEFLQVLINPFTACKISGLNDAWMRLQTCIFSGPIKSIFNAKRFDENSFTCQCEKEDIKA